MTKHRNEKLGSQIVAGFLGLIVGLIVGWVISALAYAVIEMSTHPLQTTFAEMLAPTLVIAAICSAVAIKLVGREQSSPPNANLPSATLMPNAHRYCSSSGCVVPGKSAACGPAHASCNSVVCFVGSVTCPKRVKPKF